MDCKPFSRIEDLPERTVNLTFALSALNLRLRAENGQNGGKVSTTTRCH
jgi:hypothetical protein